MLFRKKSPPPERQANAPGIRCSFCNKSQYEVARLVAGPKVYICNECVDICLQVLEHERPHTERPGRGDNPLWCSICHREVPLANMVAVPDRGYVCTDCATAVAAALPRTN